VGSPDNTRYCHVAIVMNAQSMEHIYPMAKTLIGVHTFDAIDESAHLISLIPFG